MLDHTETDDTVPARAHAKALRNGEYASLTSRAVTDNSHALIDDVYQRVTDYEILHGSVSASASVQRPTGVPGTAPHRMPYKAKGAHWGGRSG